MKRSTPLRRTSALRRAPMKRKSTRLRGTYDDRINGHLSARERFFASVSIGDGCWEWTAGKTKGYGQFVVLGVPTYAHRFSYEINNGPIPEDLEILHSCGNPCVRPDHLRPGTHKQNMEDMSAHGRAERVAAAQITHAQIEEIKASLEALEAARHQIRHLTLAGSRDPEDQVEVRAA